MTEQTRPQPNSDALYDLLSAYLDDAVTGPERAQVEQHVAESPEAAAELESLRQTVALLANLPPVAAPRPFTLTAADVGQAEPARKKGWLPLPGWLGGLAAAAVAVLCVLAAGGMLLAGPLGGSGSAPAEVAMQREIAAPAAEADMAAEAETAGAAVAEMVQEEAPAEVEMAAEAAPAEPQEAPLLAVEATSLPQELPLAAADEAAKQEEEVAAKALPPQTEPAQEAGAAAAEESLEFAEESASDEAQLAAPLADDAAGGIAAEAAAPAPAQKEAAPAEAAPPASEGEADAPAMAAAVPTTETLPEQENRVEQAAPALTVLPPTATPLLPAVTPTAAATRGQSSVSSRALVSLLAVTVVTGLAALGFWLLLGRKTDGRG